MFLFSFPSIVSPQHPSPSHPSDHRGIRPSKWIVLCACVCDLDSCVLVNVFVCAVHACGYPGSPAHAIVTMSTEKIAVNTKATYTCDNGYELLGPARRTCQANGTWTPAGIPFCGEYTWSAYVPLSPVHTNNVSYRSRWVRCRSSQVEHCLCSLNGGGHN